MKKIYIYKAQPIGDSKVEQTNIIIKNKLPKFNDIETSRSFFTDEAQKIEETLFNTIPGGTYDRLLGEMLKRKASSFVVPFGGKE